MLNGAASEAEAPAAPDEQPTSRQQRKRPRANLARVGAHLAKEAPDFDAGNYGFARLSDLVAASGLVEMESTGDHPASSKSGSGD
ncbi:hypothetical protein GOE03_31570 [Sinorhizobium medicae]|nr:hypothetical protein [Sinorhizobium medicae]